MQHPFYTVIYLNIYYLHVSRHPSYIRVKHRHHGTKGILRGRRLSNGAVPQGFSGTTAAEGQTWRPWGGRIGGLSHGRPKLLPGVSGFFKNEVLRNHPPVKPTKITKDNRKSIVWKMKFFFVPWPIFRCVFG